MAQRQLPLSGTVPNRSGVGFKFTHLYKNQFNLIDNKVVQIVNTVVFSFTVDDLNDPIVGAAEQLVAWENSESGKFVMQHAVETPIWHQHKEPVTYSTRFRITARLKEKDYTFWLLKWGQPT